MFAMLAAFGAEVSTRTPVFVQIQKAPLAIAATFVIIIAASVSSTCYDDYEELALHLCNWLSLSYTALEAGRTPPKGMEKKVVHSMSFCSRLILYLLKLMELLNDCRLFQFSGEQISNRMASGECLSSVRGTFIPCSMTRALS